MEEARQGRGLREGTAGLFQRRQVRRHFIRIDEGAETDNGDRGWGGVSKAELANT